MSSILGDWRCQSFDRPAVNAMATSVAVITISLIRGQIINWRCGVG